MSSIANMMAQMLLQKFGPQRQGADYDHMYVPEGDGGRRAPFLGMEVNPLMIPFAPQSEMTPEALYLRRQLIASRGGA